MTGALHKVLAPSRLNQDKGFCLVTLVETPTVESTRSASLSIRRGHEAYNLLSAYVSGRTGVIFNWETDLSRIRFIVPYSASP